jgi:hypothetical protein
MRPWTNHFASAAHPSQRKMKSDHAMLQLYHLNEDRLAIQKQLRKKHHEEETVSLECSSLTCSPLEYAIEHVLLWIYDCLCFDIGLCCHEL